MCERYLDPWNAYGFVPDESRIEVKWYIGASGETEVVRCSTTAMAHLMVTCKHECTQE